MNPVKAPAVTPWPAARRSAAPAHAVHQPQVRWRQGGARGLAERARETRIETVILAPGQNLAALTGDAAAADADASTHQATTRAPGRLPSRATRPN